MAQIDDYKPLTLPGFEAELAAVQWVSDRQKLEFIDVALEHLGCDEDIAFVRKALKVMGRPSQFLEAPIGSWDDAVTHWEAHAEWVRQDEERQQREAEAARFEAHTEEPVVVQVRRGRPAKAPKVVDQELEKLRLEWHDAVRQRDEAMSIADAQVREQMRQLRDTREKYKRDWDAYVASRHSAYKSRA